MIFISVDEGYAYDFFTILVVKNRMLNTSGTFSNVMACDKLLTDQVGLEKHSQIVNSKEYENLLNCNLETFQAVEKARYGEISAKEVDDLNMKRYNYKVALQNKFFPEQKVTEQKS